MTDIATSVRQVRAHVGESQEAFAHRLGVSKNTVSQWETGAATPHFRQLCAVAELIGPEHCAWLLLGVGPGPAAEAA